MSNREFCQRRYNLFVKELLYLQTGKLLNKRVIRIRILFILKIRLEKYFIKECNIVIEEQNIEWMKDVQR